MRRGLLARSRAVGGCALAALTAGIAGCSTTSASSTVAVSGKTLTIYGSAPSSSANPAQAQDIIDAEKLALQQGGSTVGSFTIKFVPVTASKVTDNARTAIKDPTTIAYLGEPDPGTSGPSITITNYSDILQVSPADTALQYTQKTAAVPDSPQKYYAEAYSTYGYTFARVVPSTALEAKAQIQEMQSLHVKKLYVTDDGGDYGKAIALAVNNDAAAASLPVQQGPAGAAQFKTSGADAVFDGASSSSAAVNLFNGVATAVPRTKLFGPSALATDAFTSGLSSAARPDVVISQPGFLPKDLTPAGQTFVTDFQSAYGHQPAREAIFGYEAMSAVVSVLRQAGANANQRSLVVHDFLTMIKNRSSVLGTYSIVNGDPTIGPFVFNHFDSAIGKLVPFTFVSVQG